MLLALDPGLRTGWARSDGAVGTLDYAGALWGEASTHFSAWLVDQIDAGVKGLAYETVIVRYAHTAFATGIVWDAIRTAHLHHLPIPRGISPQQRLRALGLRAGRLPVEARKREVLGAVRDRGWNAMNFHEADAVAVLIAAQMP